MKGDGERIMVSTLEKVAHNHQCRYDWAIEYALRQGCTTAIDGACGIGYGSLMMAKRGLKVTAIDRSTDAAEYFGRFSHPSIEFIVSDLDDVTLPEADIGVTIESVEHLDNDVAWLKKLRASCRHLALTVPNQAVIPFDPQTHKWHKRHYTKYSLSRILDAAGWEPLEWHTQYEKWNRDRAVMRPGDDGMTLGVFCR